MKKLYLISLILIFAFSFCTDEEQPTVKKVNPNFNRVSLASPQQSEHIKGSLEKGLTADHIYAFKSKDFKQVYFVAARIKGPGLGNDTIGVWSIMGEKTSPGIIFSVNHMAKEFSVVPFGPETKFKITMSDDGADLVRDYVREKIKNN